MGTLFHESRAGGRQMAGSSGCGWHVEAGGAGCAFERRGGPGRAVAVPLAGLAPSRWPVGGWAAGVSDPEGRRLAGRALLRRLWSFHFRLLSSPGNSAEIVFDYLEDWKLRGEVLLNPGGLSEPPGELSQQQMPGCAWTS